MSHESIMLLIGWFLGFPIYQFLLKPYLDKKWDEKHKW